MLLRRDIEFKKGILCCFKLHLILVFSAVLLLNVLNLEGVVMCQY